MEKYTELLNDYICGEIYVGENKNGRRDGRVDEDVDGRDAGGIETAASESHHKFRSMGGKLRGRAW